MTVTPDKTWSLKGFPVERHGWREMQPCQLQKGPNQSGEVKWRSRYASSVKLLEILSHVSAMLSSMMRCDCFEACSAKRRHSAAF